MRGRGEGEGERDGKREGDGEPEGRGGEEKRRVRGRKEEGVEKRRANPLEREE